MERSFTARAADTARTGAAAELGDDAVSAAGGTSASEPNCGSTMPMSRPSTAKSNEPAGACGRAADEQRRRLPALVDRRIERAR